jgi:hypothetical protein
VKQSGESTAFIGISRDGAFEMNSTSTLGPPDEEGGGVESVPARPSVPDTRGAPEAGIGGSLSKDELFHLLQNSRRRAVLRYLRGREGPVRMRDVAEQVAAWEHDTTVAGLSSDERQRVYIALYQSHLDALAEAGVIAYDKSRGTVEPLPPLDRVAAYADRPASDGSVAESGPAGVEDGDDGPDPEIDRADTSHRDGGGDAWARRYLGASVAGALLLAGVALDLPVFEALSGVASGVLVLLLFTGLTAARLALGAEDDRTRVSEIEG